MFPRGSKSAASALGAAGQALWKLILEVFPGHRNLASVCPASPAPLLPCSSIRRHSFQALVVQNQLWSVLKCMFLDIKTASWGLGSGICILMISSVDPHAVVPASELSYLAWWQWGRVAGSQSFEAVSQSVFMEYLQCASSVGSSSASAIKYLLLWTRYWTSLNFTYLEISLRNEFNISSLLKYIQSIISTISGTHCALFLIILFITGCHSWEF